MEGYFIGKSGRDWYVCKVSADGPQRVLTGTLVDVVNFMAGVAGEDGVPCEFYATLHGARIGTARTEPDGSIGVTLYALPTAGTFYLKPA